MTTEWCKWGSAIGIWEGEVHCLGREGRSGGSDNKLRFLSEFEITLNGEVA